MKRRLGYIFFVLYNLIRMPVKTLISGFKISNSPIQLISPLASIASDRGGTVRIKGASQIAAGAMVKASGGRIVLNGGFIGKNSNIVSKKEIIIGAGVTIAPNVCIYDHDHNHEFISDKKAAQYICAPVKIEDNVWIGANAVICKGVTIGKGAVVAAGATVIKDVPENTLVGGVPAKILKQYVKT